MNSSFKSGLAIVSSLPDSIANFDPYSVVVVVRIYESYFSFMCFKITIQNKNAI